jgi:arylsulfatase B
VPVGPAGLANVLVILLDDVGVDQVSPYGFPDAAPTPHLESLAAEGLRFDQAWATPTCSPTRAALLTGQLSHRNHVGAVIHAETTHELPLEAITLPEMLDRSGTDWSAAAVGKWHLSTHRSDSGYRHPLLQGFDLYAGGLNNISVMDTLQPKSERTYVNWERVGFDGRVSLEDTFATQQTTDDALEALRRMRPPWLLYVAYQAAHRPLMVPPAELTGDLRVDPGDEQSLYTANLVAADHEIGRLLAALGPERERTLVVVLGDNGTPKHAKEEEGQEGHKGSMTEGGLRVPFLVAGPGVVKGQRSDALVHVVDVFPTLMELAGVRSVGADLEGRSLVPLFQQPSGQVRERMYTELRQPADGPPWRRVLAAARDESLKVMSVDGVVTLHRVQGFVEEEIKPSQLTGPEQRRVNKLEGELSRHR